MAYALSTTTEGQASMNDTDTRDQAPPKLNPLGHAVLTGQRAAMGGRVLLTLTGTPDRPRLYADTPDDFSGVAVHSNREDLVRFARELLKFCGEDIGVKLTPWRPAVNGTSRRPWFLTRDGQGIPLEDAYHYGAAGNLVRYASMETAQRAADKLNAQEGQAAS